MKLHGEIRSNIALLEPFAEHIGKCKSFNDLFSIFFRSNNINDRLKGAIGENFADELCIQYGPDFGFVNFRPSSEREDIEEGTDAVGMTHKHVTDEGNARAIRQDKTYDPFNPESRLDMKDLAGLMIPMSEGTIDGNNVMVFTTLHEDQISLQAQKAFPWILARNHYESRLKNNRQFFIDLSMRIINECNELESRRAANSQFKKIRLRKFQKEALDHAMDHKRSFICLPPGSGKTEIQSHLAKEWLKNHHTLVYVAPTLALLDQNFYKVARYCHGKYPKFHQAIIACSGKDFSIGDCDRGFLKKNELVFGSADSEEVQNAITRPGKKIIATTYKSYPRLVEFFAKNNLAFDRIADEALEAVPSRVPDCKEEAEDAIERAKLWDAFCNNDVIKRSACFDAFQKERYDSSIVEDGVGTNNIDVFGEKFLKTFDEMIEVGTIVETKIRAMVVNTSDIRKMKGYHQHGWTDDDKINFTALCHTIDHVIQDESIVNKKIVAFMHSAKVCPKFVIPLRKYLNDQAIQFTDAIIADTDNRNEILDGYRNAEHALLLNYGVLGKGIDDATTNAAFVGRNMASIYGLHGIHRPCRSHPDEFGKKPHLHKLKPCGYVYVVVEENDMASKEQYNDLFEIMKQIYQTVGYWKDDIEVVRVVHSRDTEDDPVNQPEKVFENKSITKIEELSKIIRIRQEEFMNMEICGMDRKTKDMNMENMKKFNSDNPT